MDRRTQIDGACPACGAFGANVLCEVASAQAAQHLVLARARIERPGDA